MQSETNRSVTGAAQGEWRAGNGRPWGDASSEGVRHTCVLTHEGVRGHFPQLLSRFDFGLHHGGPGCQKGGLPRSDPIFRVGAEGLGVWSLGKGFLLPGGDYPGLRLCGAIQPDVRGRSRYSRCQGHREEGAFYSPMLHQGLREGITVSTDYRPHGPTSISYQHTRLFLSLITVTRETTTVSLFLLWPATQRAERRGAGKPLHTRCWNVLCSPAPVPVSCESCAAFLHPEESLAWPGLHWRHGCSCTSKPNSKVSNSSQHRKKREKMPLS